MASTITPRTGSVLSGTSPPGAGVGIIQTTNVAGTNTITCDSTPLITSYVEHQLFLIRPLNACTGPVTVNITDEDGVALGAKAWVKPNGSDFDSGDTSPNQDYLVKYTGVLFRTIAPF